MVNNTLRLKDSTVVDTTDIEKKSLEAHVELCAERYRYLEDKLENVECKLTSLDKVVNEIKVMLHDVVNKRNDQIIKWGVGIIGSLVVILGILLKEYVFR